MSCSYPNRLDTVVAYVREELPPEAQDAFESHYFDCADCAREVFLVEKTTLAMKRHGHYIFAPAYAHQASFLTRCADRLALNWEKLSLHMGRTRLLLNYAVLIVLASAGVWLFQKMDGLLQGPDKGGQLVNLEGFFSGPGVDKNAAKFSWPDDFSAVGEPALRAELQALREAYEHQEYLAVASSLASLAEKYPYEMEIGVLRGISLFKAGRLEEAVTQLSAITPQHGAPASAYWFLALAYWQQQQNEPAQRVLQTLLHQPDTSYHQEARYLLQHLPH